jgi:hypothetical protein
MFPAPLPAKTIVETYGCLAYDAGLSRNGVPAAGDNQRVAAFAMPGTCEPEGYTAEKRKGNARVLAGGAKACFVTRVGYVDKEHAASAAARIEGQRR